MLDINRIRAIIIDRTNRLRLGGGGDDIFKNLEAEMARYDIAPKDLAECISVNERTMRSYLSGTSRIAWEDARKIKHRYFPQFEMEYLFYFVKEDAAS